MKPAPGVYNLLYVQSKPSFKTTNKIKEGGRKRGVVCNEEFDHMEAWDDTVDV